MKMRTIAFVAGLTLGSPALAAADCDAEVDTTRVMECLGANLKAADAELDTQFQSLLVVTAGWDDNAGTSSGGTEQRLMEAQNAWTIFRDAECALRSAAMDGGSGQAILDVGCRAKLARERVEHLREVASIFGPGDMNADEDCYTLGEVVRRLASLHQYGDDMHAFIDGLVQNGIDADKIESYRRIASDIAASPRLLTEEDREFAIEYHVEHYQTLCM